MQKHNSELFLETEGGVATPLSLVHIEEEFNTSPSVYQGKEFVKPARKSLIGPLSTTRGKMEILSTCPLGPLSQSRGR